MLPLFRGVFCVLFVSAGNCFFWEKFSPSLEKKGGEKAGACSRPDKNLFACLFQEDKIDGKHQKEHCHKVVPLKALALEQDGYYDTEHKTRYNLLYNF